MTTLPDVSSLIDPTDKPANNAEQAADAARQQVLPDMPASTAYTDGPAAIARQATPLLRDLLAEWERLCDLLWSSDKPLDDPDRFRIIIRQVDLFGTCYMLAALRHVDPVRADRAAAFLADQWEGGDSLGEWVYQWRQELAGGDPLTLFLEGS